jgi:chaperonin cofactor prefoldin
MAHEGGKLMDKILDQLESNMEALESKIPSSKEEQEWIETELAQMTRRYNVLMDS